MDLADLVSSSLVDEILTPVIDAEIKRQEDKPNFRAEGFHPSEVAGKCPRFVVLNRILPDDFRAKNNFSLNLYRIFNDGHAAHQWYQERYLGPAGVLWGTWICSRCKKEITGFMPKDSCDCQRESGLVPPFCYSTCWDKTLEGEPTLLREGMHAFRQSVKFRGGCVHCGQHNARAWGEWKYKEISVIDKSLGVVGNTDGPVCIDGRWYLLEIKTINDAGFTFMKGVKPLHKAQAQTYMHVIKKKGEPYSLIEGVLFLYINKNGVKKKAGRDRKEMEYIVPWDDDGDKTIAGIQKMKSAIDEESLPKMDWPGCTQTKNKNRCPLWTICKVIGKEKAGWKEAVSYGK